MVKKRFVIAALAVTMLLAWGFPQAQSDSHEVRRLKIYRVPPQHTEAIARAIDMLYPYAVVNEDKQTGRLHVSASEKLQMSIEEVIQKLIEQKTRPGVDPELPIEDLESKAAIRALLAQIVELRQRVEKLEELHEKGRIIPLTQ